MYSAFCWSFAMDWRFTNKKSKQAVFSHSPVDASISPIPCGYYYGIIDVVSELSDLVYFLFTFAHTMTMLPIINKVKFFSYQRPTAYRYGSGPERSGGMLSSRPNKCWYAILANTVSLPALFVAAHRLLNKRLIQ